MGKSNGENSSKDTVKSSLLERLSNIEYTNIKPELTKVIGKDLSDPEWNEIKELYSHKDYQLIACLINGLISSETPVFMLTKRIFEALVKSDDNLKRKTINSQEYKRMISNSIEIGLIDCIVKPSGFNEQKKIAGLYFLKDKKFQKLIEDADEKSKKIFKTYFEFQKHSKLDHETKIKFQKLLGVKL